MTKVLKNIPELPAVKRKRYLSKLNLKPADIEIILQDYALMNFFEAAIKLSPHYEMIAHYLIGDISAYLNQKGLTISETALSPQNLVEMIMLINQNVISNKQAKIVLQRILNEDCAPTKIVAELGLKQISDPVEINKIIEPVFNANIVMLEQYEQRPERVINFFMGELMKLTKAQVAPEIGKQVVIELITAKQGK